MKRPKLTTSFCRRVAATATVVGAAILGLATSPQWGGNWRVVVLLVIGMLLLHVGSIALGALGPSTPSARRRRHRARRDLTIAGLRAHVAALRADRAPVTPVDPDTITRNLT